MTYVRKTRAHDPAEVSYRDKLGQVRRGSFYRRIEDSYSWRTGKKSFQDSLVVGGGLNVTPYGGRAGHLAAEISAIQEVNESLKQSSVLKEGTWGVKDAGHVFSVVKSKGVLQTYTRTSGSPRLFYDERKALTFNRIVDPFSWKVFSQLGKPELSGGETWVGSYQPVVPFSDLADQCSRILVDSSPDLSDGGLGETLAELHSIPGLLRNLYDMRLIATSLYKKWVKLPDKVKREVNLGFRAKGATKDLSKEGADAYLQWSFALKPLIEESRALLEAAMGLSHTLTSSTSRVRNIPHTLVESYDSAMFGIKGYTSTTYPSGPSVGGVVASPGNLDNFGGIRAFSDLDVRIALRYRLTKPVHGWQEQATILNQKLGVVYPSLLWDLSPWSFLIDWFSHIGRVVDGVYAITKGRYTPDYCWATAKCRSSVIWGDTAYSRGGWTYTSHFSGAPFTESTGRIPISQWGGLKPYFKDLSGTQKNLLVALGLSRLNN